MTNSTLEEIEAAAGKATVGDWTIRPKHPQCVIGLLANGVGVIVADTSGDTDMTSEQWAANAAYIALLDPQTVLALISELRAAREALTTAQAELNATRETCSLVRRQDYFDVPTPILVEAQIEFEKWRQLTDLSDLISGRRSPIDSVLNLYRAALNSKEP